MFYFFESNSFNPYQNLAIEEYFLELANQYSNMFILYFWQNDNVVVIGRNQDAFCEVNLNFLQENKILLARRKTGGGAVFHDKNNLNFSFIVPKNKFNKEKSSLILKNAIDKLGVNVEISGRNDLLIQGKKFSGNAYLNKENVVLHHGTILLDTDFDILTKVLNVDAKKLSSHGVKSVESRVFNLKTLFPQITIADVKKNIKYNFQKSYNISCENFVEKFPDLTCKINEFSSDEFVYGDKKFADVKTFSKKLSFGMCQLKVLNLNKKKFIKLYSDALDVDFIDIAESYLNQNISKNNFLDERIVEIFEFYREI